ncbi:MAG: flavodoxin family protein [Massiliimalia sp.]|jgi:multimeric flavodoxin WrbA
MKLILTDKPIDRMDQISQDIKYIDLSSCNIANCVGCFGCWTKTPGKCVIRDDAVKVYPYIAQSDQVMYISRIRYGGYDTVMKTMLERAIPIQQAFIRLVNGETHHVQRNVVPKQATVIAYGAEDKEEQELFSQLVARNAHNMNFESYQIIFTEESKLEEVVKREVEQWEKS